MLSLNAIIRKDSDSLKAIRAESKIPAVVYGPNFPSQNVLVDYQEFRKVIRSAEMHTVFELDIAGKKAKVLVKDFARDKVSDEYIHIDFYVIDEKKEVIVPVPVSFEGQSPAMKVGAILTVAIPKVKVKTLPQNIPSKIVADISVLAADGDKIRVSDLQQVPNVKVTIVSNAMVAKTELSRAAKKAAV